MSGPEKSGKGQRRARGSLSAEEIISTAIALVGESGVDALSMPSLARDLNAGVMSIYWYFHSKDDLLVAMADRAFLDVYSHLPNFDGGSWESEVVDQAEVLHQELRKEPLYLQLCRANPRLLGLRPTVIPAHTRRIEAQLEQFGSAHQDPTIPARFLAVVHAYTRGFALMQLGEEEERTDFTPEEAIEASAEQLNPEQFPMLRTIKNVGSVVSVGDSSFSSALTLLTAGMSAMLDSA